MANPNGTTVDTSVAFVACPRESFAELVLVVAQLVRRLESHVRNPGVVDSTVMLNARRCVIAASALLRMQREEPPEQVAWVVEGDMDEVIDTEVTANGSMVATLRLLADAEAIGKADLGRYSTRVHFELQRHGVHA